MPWPVPAPGAISGRAASIYEELLPGIDARNPNTVATVNCRIVEMAMQDLYFNQAANARETMPDTAVDNLPRFGRMWSEPRGQPAAAGGSVIVGGLAANAAFPAGVTLSYTGGDGTLLFTTEAATASATGVLEWPVTAVTPGSASNLAAGTQLTVTSPVQGLPVQTVAVDGNGITGGADLEDVDDWRAQIIAEIQYEPAGGSYSDYEKWAKEALPNVALAACPPAACGGGNVAIVVIMDGLTPPTSAQIATIQAYINGLRPVTDNPTVYAGTLNPVPVTLHLVPDNATIRAAAQAALALSFAQDAVIGGTTYVSRLDNAVSSSDGETAHERILPAADVAAPNLFALNTFGGVSFT